MLSLLPAHRRPHHPARGPARPAVLSASLVAAWEHATRATSLRSYR